MEQTNTGTEKNKGPSILIVLSLVIATLVLSITVTLKITRLSEKPAFVKNYIGWFNVEYGRGEKATWDQMLGYGTVALQDHAHKSSQWFAWLDSDARFHIVFDNFFPTHNLGQINNIKFFVEKNEYNWELEWKNFFPIIKTEWVAKWSNQENPGRVGPEILPRALAQIQGNVPGIKKFKIKYLQ
ncbi:hypothetical protein CL633_04100 [bacterium]|nr:hypothetical protein [bacterium]|tara:strand:+ start:3164 stop:3715 length:552 start_codon:yes stop_codon:yes gene_type:complete